MVWLPFGRTSDAVFSGGVYTPIAQHRGIQMSGMQCFLCDICLVCLAMARAVALRQVDFVLYL